MEGKNKLKRFKLIVIGIILILTGIIASFYNTNTVIGKKITIGNKSKNLSNGGDYINKFVDEMEKRNFYVVKWDEIKNKYYTSTGTYESNTASKKRVVCMNESKSDWYNEYSKTYEHLLRPVAIIDIEGGLVKVQGTIKKDGYNGDRKYVGKYAAQLAYAAYEEGNANSSFAETYINYRDGWKNFIHASSNIIDLNKEQSFKTYPSKKIGPAYYDLSNKKDKYLNIVTAGTGVGTEESNNVKKTVGTFTVNGEKYKTKVGDYALRNVQNKANKTVKLIAKSGKEYTGIIKQNSQGKYNLYFKKNISEEIKKIEFTQSYQSYRARIIVFVTNFSQNRAIMAGDENYNVTYTVNLKIPKENVNVSLQKYITKVNGNSLTNNETKLTNRKNTMINRGDTDTSKHPSKNNSIVNTNGKYKFTDLVQIEAGDTVIYRIHVYNNSDVTATKVEVTDTLLYYNNTSQYGDYEIVNITRDGNSRNIKNDWTYVGGTTPHKYKYTINNLAGGAETYFDITVKLNKYLPNIIGNNAEITSTVPTNNTTYRTADRDYIKMKPYKVSLQKIVYSVNGNTSGITSFDRWSSWESKENIANKNVNTYRKHNNPVTVASGDYVTYAIKVKNDGETIVKNLKVKDILPNGLSEYKEGLYSSSGTYTARPNNGEITLNINRQLDPGKEFVLYITAKVSESNMSTRVLPNRAEIVNDQITNKNSVVITDTTPNNNQDADYIQLKDITIGGTVWNDMALDKKQDNYNGLYDEGQENKLEGIKVNLLRANRNGQGYTRIADTKTDANGNYKFDASMIYDSIHICERHIKAEYQCTSEYTNGQHQANYWKENSYYSYIIQFVYDGITYTSTIQGSIDADNYKINSNASENETTRKEFNNKFAKINKDSGINYKTINENGYKPQSIHIYDESKMAMTSNAYITINESLNEDQLQYINLGLRGRDIFDLELTSNVNTIDVTINGQPETYQYTNKVTVRKSDLAEDMANIEKESDKDFTYVNGANNTPTNAKEGEQQKIRNTDKSYLDSIYVTYRITVSNAARTVGTATKVINYYDNKYTFEKATVGNYEATIANGKATEGKSGTGFKSIIIETPGTTQSDEMNIDVRYKLTDAGINELKKLNNTGVMPTYNIAEVYEYKTECADGQTEFTRGLIDKDSAPGSANEEQVRLTSTVNQETATKGGNPTTVEYYFGGNDLSKLKYEDDTYATPTLYFVSDSSVRKLSGTVFRDATEIKENNIKTGNGKKDENEDGVFGANVTLTVKVANSNETKEYKAKTDNTGFYTISNFIPGEAKVTYKYGDTEETVLLNKAGNGINKYSFNGEDYQSTNNTGTYGAAKLNDADKKFWYAFNENEGVSTGTDDVARRKEVSQNVTEFTDDEMIALNKMRAGEEVTKEEIDNIINKTNMFAITPNLTLSVEKTVQSGEEPKQNDIFGDYTVKNMNFGIAEVPVTTIDLQKHVQSFTIKDSTGENVIASATKAGEGWSTEGNTKVLPGQTDIEIEDDKLQGAKLEVEYAITSKIDVEKNFDGTTPTNATITGLVDYIDNDLSYNKDLGDNNDYWKETDYKETLESFKEASFKNSKGEIIERTGGYIDSDGNKQDGSKHSSIIKAKEGNPILSATGGTALITLEKELSATESTVEDIITSNINTYEYDNNIEITNIKYTNTETEAAGKNFLFRDRVRTPKTDNPTTSRMTILAGAQYDTATSELITIHPPTGENNSITYYIIAAVSLAVLATGIVLIKKYAIKK